MPTTEEGIPLLRRTNAPSAVKCWTGAVCILFSHAFEHYAFNSVTLNFKYFLAGKSYAWTPENISNITYLLDALSMFMAILGGLLADFLLHRMILVVIVYLCYIFGVLGLSLLYLNAENNTSPTVPNLCRPHNHSSAEIPSFAGSRRPLAMENCVEFIETIVCLVAIGSGMARIILIVLGADNVRHLGAKSVSIYFFIYCIFWNLGDWFADGVGSYLNTNHHQTQLIILAAVVCVSAIILFVARFLFIVRLNQASLSEILNVLKDTFKRRNDHECEVESIFDRAKLSLGGTCNDNQVEGVKRVRNIFILFWVFVPFMIIINLYNFYIEQGIHMRLPYVAKHILMPPSWVHSLENVGVLFVIAPLVYIGLFVVKGGDRYQLIYIRSRVLIGMGLAMVSVLLAGILESQRLGIFWGWNNNSTEPRGTFLNQTLGEVTYQAANLSVLWTIPQFVLLGGSELLIFITSIEYIYLSAVPWLQCTSVGLIWATQGMGTLLVFLLRNSNIFYMSDINTRLPCLTDLINNTSSSKLLSFDAGVGSGKKVGKLACWESRLDILFYILFAIQAVGIGLAVLMFYRLTPQILNSSYIALNEDLQGENEDDWNDQPEDEELMIQQQLSSVVKPF